MSKDWFEQEIKKAAEHWRKCIDLQGDYVEKYFMILCFKNISLCRTFGMPLVHSREHNALPPNTRSSVTGYLYKQISTSSINQDSLTVFSPLHRACSLQFSTFPLVLLTLFLFEYYLKLAEFFYSSGFQTFLSAGTGNQLNKFRGTPAIGIYSN